MKLNDAIFGLALLALGAAVLFGVQGFPRIPGQPVGPALFPGIIAGGLCIGGVVLLARGLRARARAGQPWLAWDDWVRSPRHVAALAVLIGSVLFYIAAAGALGFLPTSALILLVMFTMLRVPVPRAVLLAVVATLAIHFVFYKLLRVPLPWGVLTPYAW
ncbi:tripartite tricarboxylate transporter TctB family protein [Ramlibacter sp.]|uniref:tripartite tricarboxylate transporter TctB family protein n=1 Tax=Ramlibacter sp. TaxID=1917967 RepID=UPI002CA09D0C|nr:tripartite tricarboxylate transporter TctB family protein [Ramlibacter sp.]HWI82451.1 tripartite tricarboxylate transporter TctB family protein [Ramlibacter sp.]